MAIARQAFGKFKGLFRKRDRDIIESDFFDNSFIQGTLIHTRGGLVSIEEIEIGDEVLSYNEISNRNEYKRVTHLIQSVKTDDFVSLAYGDSRYLESTSNHPFYINGDWIEATELGLGYELMVLGRGG